jgi:hypothetical protein
MSGSWRQNFGEGEWHIGRSWSDHPLEDACSCPKAPCGLVVLGNTDPACPQHHPEKTIRQSHPLSECPSVSTGEPKQ